MRLILALVLLVCFTSCGDDKSKKPVTEESTTQEEVVVRSYEIVSDELFKNPKLNSWDTNAKPTDWMINEDVDIPEDYVIDRDTLDLLLKGHKDKIIYLKQKVNLDPNEFYLIEARIQSGLKSNSYAGILASNSEGVLGKRILEKSSDKVYEVVFNSGKGGETEIYFGFIKEGEGDIKIKTKTLKKVSLNKNVLSKDLALEYSSVIPLSFDDEQSFNNSVEKIIKKTSDLLLAKKRKDSINLEQVNRIQSILDADSYLSNYFQVSEDQITKSYTTRLIFSAIEVLDQFNIGTQRIELQRNGKRVHLLLNVYNPYSNSWITIDPFYNALIQESDNLFSINENQIVTKEYGGLSKNIEGLIKKYSGTKTVIKNEQVLGFPF